MIKFIMKSLLLVSLVTISLNSKEVSFLAVSDMHVSDVADCYPEMQAKVNLVPMMKKYIEEKKVNAVLMPGDLTTGGIKWLCNPAWEVKDKFLNEWFNPLNESLQKVLGQMFITVGNHDFDASVWPNYPAITDFINVAYGKYDPIGWGPSGRPWWMGFWVGPEQSHYAVDMDGLLFISLGYGAFGDNLNRSSRAWVGGTMPEVGGNQWLEIYLRDYVKDKTKPIILFFHVPVVGWIFGSMKKVDADRFYEIIKDYNVKAIIVGHTHHKVYYQDEPVVDSNGNPVLDVNGIQKIIKKDVSATSIYTNKNEKLSKNLRFRGFWQIDVSGLEFLHAAYNFDTDKLTAEFVDKDGRVAKFAIPTRDTVYADYSDVI